MEYLDTLYDICEVLMREMDNANEKIKKGGGEISSGDLEYLDKLTHAVKSVKTTIAMEEASFDGSSYDDGDHDNYSSRGSDGRYNRSYGGSYEGGSSYARGRGRYAKRDSMGRYSRDGRMSYGYSRDEAKSELMDHLEEMKKMAKDEETRRMVSQWERQIEKG